MKLVWVRQATRAFSCKIVFRLHQVTTVCIFYYERHLKHCQDTDEYRQIDNLLQQRETILQENARVACLTQTNFMFQCNKSNGGQPVPITAINVRSNPARGQVYTIQHYVIKFVSDLQQVSGFLRAILLLIDMSIKEHAYKQYIQYCDRSMKGNEMKGKEMNMVEHLYIHIKPPPNLL
jgi:hypothetical protein